MAVRMILSEFPPSAEQLQKDLDALGSAVHIARKYEVGVHTVRATLKKLSISKSDLDPEKLKADYQRLGSAKAIAREYGCSDTKIASRLRKFGIVEGSLKRGVRGIHLDPEKLKGDFDRLGDAAKVAAEYGISNTTVLKALHRLGVKTPRGKKPRRFEVSKEILQEAYDRLGTVAAMAKEFGVSTTTVSDRCREHGISVAPSRGPYVDLDEDEIVRAYKQTGSSVIVGRRFGVSDTTIRKRLVKAGVSLEREPILNATDSEIIEAYEIHQSMEKLATIFEVSAWTIADRLRRLGVDTSNKRHFSVDPFEVYQQLNRLKKITAVAEHYGVIPSTITNALAKGGYETGGRDAIRVAYDKVVDDYIELGSISMVAQKYGVSKGSIERRMRSVGFSPADWISDLSEEIRAESVSRYLELKNGWDVAAELGISATTVYRALQLAGVNLSEVEREPWRISLDIDDIEKRYGAGESMLAIARDMGVSIKVIKDRLHYVGVETKRNLKDLDTTEWRHRGHDGFKNLFTGRQCQHAREVLGYTQKDVAEAVGVSNSVISKFEGNSDTTPLLGIQKRLSRFFKERGVTFSDDGINFIVK